MTSPERLTVTQPRVRTQTDQVLDYLRNTGSLDQFTAKDELGVLRLGARIWDLKQRGYAIRTELIEAPTEYGGTRIAQYSLLRERARDGRGIEEDAARAEPPPAEATPPPEAVADAAHPAEPRTLDEALWTFGDRAAALGVSPTVREYQRALGAASESVAHRWLRVLEREGYLAANERLGSPAADAASGRRPAADAASGRRPAADAASGRRTAARSWLVTPPGYERLYILERARRIAASEKLARLAVEAAFARRVAVDTTPDRASSEGLSPDLERRAS